MARGNLRGWRLIARAVVAVRSDAQGDTPAGREAAAHWLGVREFYRGSGSFEEQPAAAVALINKASISTIRFQHCTNRYAAAIPMPACIG